TPALARGGSGDVLTGLMGGLIASAAQSEAWKDHPDVLIPPVLGAVWWHSQAAIYASAQRTVLGVDPLHLAQALNPSLSVLSKAYATQV
ncbi:MAG: NAD(P)H-hydrate dehydratase, partial [Cyanobacteria bacterium J06553_1]